ncbi:MAG: MATE family efflux transporter [Alphaproteobacteria bacterium]
MKLGDTGQDDPHQLREDEHVPATAAHAQTATPAETPVSGTAQTESPLTLNVWSLAWPTMAAAFMHTATRWVDVKMVGVIGADAIAGVTAGGQLYWLIQTLVMAAATGLTAIVSRAYGSRNLQEVDHAHKQSIWMGWLIGLGTWIGFIPLIGFSLAWLGLTGNAADQGADYMIWLLVGNVPMTLIFLTGAALRAGGDTITPLWTGIIANVVNIFLNWVLIYGNLGSPAFGVAGAGMATSAAIVLHTLMIFGLWWRGWTILPRGLASWKLDLSMWRRLWKIGYPTGIEGLLFQLAMLSFMSFMALYGTEAFVAYQIGVQVLSFGFLPGHGFNVAAATMVGQYLGAGQPQRAMAAGWQTMRLAMLFMGLLGLGFIAVGEPLARWFLDDDTVVPMAVTFIWILGFSLPLMSWDFTVGGALRGAGDTRTPLYTVMIALGLFRLLPGYIIAHVLHWDVVWLWSVLFLDYAARAIVLGLAFRRGKWQNQQV